MKRMTIILISLMGTLVYADEINANHGGQPQRAAQKENFDDIPWDTALKPHKKTADDDLAVNLDAYMPQPPLRLLTNNGIDQWETHKLESRIKAEGGVPWGCEDFAVTVKRFVNRHAVLTTIIIIVPIIVFGLIIIVPLLVLRELVNKRFGTANAKQNNKKSSGTIGVMCAVCGCLLSVGAFAQGVPKGKVSATNLVDVALRQDIDDARMRINARLQVPQKPRIPEIPLTYKNSQQEYEAIRLEEYRCELMKYLRQTGCVPAGEEEWQVTVKQFVDLHPGWTTLVIGMLLFFPILPLIVWMVLRQCRRHNDAHQ